MTDWRAIIRKNKPDVSNATIKSYNSTLTNLLKKLEEEDADSDYFNVHFKEVLKNLKNTPYTSRKSILACLLAVTTDEKAREAYRKQMLIDIADFKGELELQKMTAKQQKNWVPWSKVLEIYKKLERRTDHLWDEKDLTREELKNLMKFVTLSCFVLIPPRRIMDYQMFKLKNVDKEKDNYMDGLTFVFNQFKTKKAYGTQVVDIPKRLRDIILRWHRKFPESEWLVFGNTHKQMSQPQLTNMIETIFGDKNISVSMLRHIYISDQVLKDTPKLTELDKVAQEMGHSVDQQIR